MAATPPVIAISPMPFAPTSPMCDGVLFDRDEPPQLGANALERFEALRETAGAANRARTSGSRSNASRASVPPLRKEIAKGIADRSVREAPPDPAIPRASLPGQLRAGTSLHGRQSPIAANRRSSPSSSILRPLADDSVTVLITAP